MGMTIEKIIKTFDYIKHVGNGESEYKHCREEIALDEAVAIMRKYQQIQEIIRWNEIPSPYYKPDGQLFREICEVLEDGNDDCD